MAAGGRREVFSATMGKATKTTKAATKKLVAEGTKAQTAAAKRAEELLELIARAKERITEDFFEIGEALRELQKKKLYVALGFDSFAELLQKRKVMSSRSAEKLIEVVGALPRTKALDLGVERAYALARLSAATPALDSAESLLAEGVKVGGRKKAVAKLSTRDLVKAAQAARPVKKDAAKDAAARSARALQAAVRKAGGKGATGVARKTAAGWVVQLDVPTAGVEAVVRALE